MRSTGAVDPFYLGEYVRAGWLRRVGDPLREVFAKRIVSLQSRRIGRVAASVGLGLAAFSHRPRRRGAAGFGGNPPSQRARPPRTDRRRNRLCRSVADLRHCQHHQRTRQHRRRRLGHRSAPIRFRCRSEPFVAENRTSIKGSPITQEFDRLKALDEHIAKLVQARLYLSGARHCRYDHPATDCEIMGARSIAGSPLTIDEE